MKFLKKLFKTIFIVIGVISVLCIALVVYIIQFGFFLSEQCVCVLNGCRKDIRCKFTLPYQRFPDLS